MSDRNETALARADRPPTVVAIMGSYRRRGTIDTTVDELLLGASEAGADTRKIELLDQRIEHCLNCRECCQEPGPERGHCALDDDVPAILDALDAADAVVLAAPVNCGDVNAMTRALMERMLGYAYWPWGQPAPKPRHEGPRKPAALVTSSAAPGFLTRWFARPIRTLRLMARMMGARPVGDLIVGLAGERGAQPDEKARRKARALGRRLVSAR